jgi:hypothetical protein
MKNLLLAVIITAIHYSAFGNYLVNQDGQRITIQGHPKMICFRPHGELRGTFQKARGSTIWIIADEWNGNKINNWYVEIEKPVCEILKGDSK